MPTRHVEVALLFTDIVGSTAKWDVAPHAMREALARHDILVSKAVAGHGGSVLKHTGDGVIGRFESVGAALRAGLDIQRLLADEDFSAIEGLAVRMAVHVGTAEERDGDLFGPALNRAARVVDAANGGQLLLTDAARSALGRSPGGYPEPEMVDHGPQRLRGIARHERLWAPIDRNLPAALAPPRSLNASTGNLPGRLTGLVGREELVGSVCSLLADPALVTLVGPGGVGKTSVALHAGARMAARLPDGVWVVELASVSETDEVAAVVAATLGLAGRRARSIVETLRDALGVRDTLVVLDNAEHVRSGVATFVGSVSRPGSATRFLCTSQVALGVPGELTVTVPPLPVPPAAGEADGWGPAVRLFAERARSANPDFRLDRETEARVASICAHLDGLPLAIELAAARADVLSVDRIAAGLSRRFELLTSSPGGALRETRHTTMSAALDWSVGLLSAPACDRLALFSVFRSRFGLDDAVAVAGEGAGELEVAGSLSELCSHSLLSVERLEGESRYRMLETVRVYAGELLSLAGRESDAHGAHAHHFLSVARGLATSLEGPDGVALIAGGELDLPDHRQAFEHLVGTDPVAAATMVSDLRSWWLVCGSSRVGLGWAEEALAALGGDAAVPSEALVGLLCASGTFAAIAGDHAVSDRHLRAAIDASVALGREPPPHALAMLATAAVLRGEPGEGLRLAHQALDAAEPSERRSVERFLGATLALAGEGEAGVAMGQRAVDSARGSPLWLSSSLVNLALAGSFLGTPAALAVALDAATEAVGAARAVRSRYYEGGAWAALVGIQRALGDRRASLVAAAEAMTLLLSAGAVQYLLLLLDSVAHDLLDTCPEVVATITSATYGPRSGRGASGRNEEEARRRLSGRISGRLDPGDFEAAWERGHRLSLDEVVLLARAAVEDAAY